VLGIAANYTEENGLLIYTSKYLSEHYNKKAIENGYASINTEGENYRTIANNILLVNKNERYGITDLSLNEKVGIKYDTIKFNEQAKEFIVSSGNKYGIIDETGDIKINLFYDEITIMNYSPLLYKVKNNDKFGILNADGQIIANVQYEAIGCEVVDDNNGEKSAIIIPNINEETNISIVVKEASGYGLINAENGEMIIDSNLKKIYSTMKNGQIVYEAIYGEQKVDLKQYVKAVNTIVIPM